VADILLSVEAEGHGAPKPERRRRGRREVPELPREELERLIRTLEEEMHEAAKDLRFEYAARLRDEVRDLRKELSALREAGVR
jgi:excinuclease ABC subunit B